MTRIRAIPWMQKAFVGLLAAFSLQLPNDAKAASRGEAAETSARRAPSKTIRFSHRDAELLTVGQKVSSIMYLPRMDLVSRANPLLVMLHGVNESRTLYPWFGGTHDLRPSLKAIASTAQRGFIVAAPTQTKNAWMASQMWPDFDIKAFVADLRAALPEGLDVDSRAIYLAGHSAAGCNPKGGLAEIPTPSQDFAVAGVAFIDTCFDVSVAQRLSSRQPDLPIWIVWQAMTWRRDPQPFLDALVLPDAPPPRLLELQPRSANPHVGILYSAVELLTREWLMRDPVTTQTQRHTSKEVAERPGAESASPDPRASDE